MKKISPLSTDPPENLPRLPNSSCSNHDRESSHSKTSSEDRESKVNNVSNQQKEQENKRKKVSILSDKRRSSPRKSIIHGNFNSFNWAKNVTTLPPISNAPKLARMDNNKAMETRIPIDELSEHKENSCPDHDRSEMNLVHNNGPQVLLESQYQANTSFHDQKVAIVDKLEMFSEHGVDGSESDFKNQRCIFRAHAGNRLKWEIFIIFLAIWNGFSIPFSVAFYEEDQENIGWLIVNSFTDFLFFIDVLINFRTTYMDEATSEEIFDSRLIAIQYLKGRFWVDMVASIPFDLLARPFFSKDGDSTVFQMLGILKLIRILRLSRLISFMNLKDDVKMSLKLLRLLFFIILYIHFIACTLFFFRKENSWLPPLEYGWKDEDLFQASSSRQYSTSLYHSMLVLAGNDIAPASDLSFFLQTALLLISSIINASIFGNIAVLLQQLNLKAAHLQEKVENANSTMKSLRIPEDIQKEVMKYILNTHNNLEQQNELDTFLLQLSPSLQQIIRKSILKDVISQNNVFASLEGAIAFILRDLSILLFQPESIIIRQGDDAKEMYFIANGECAVYVNDKNKGEIQVNQIKEGDYFGEVALIKDCKRTATVKSLYCTTLAGYHKDRLSELFEKNITLLKRMEKKIHKNYQDKWKKFMITALRNIEFLETSNISDETIEEITYKVNTVSYSAGSYLFKQNQRCTDIIIVASGEVIISINNNQLYDIKLDILYPGCTIGSYSLLNQDDHCISAMAKTDCSVILINYRLLDLISNTFEKIGRSIEDTFDYIKENGLPFLDYRMYRTKKMSTTPKQKFKNGISRILKIVKSYKINDFQGLLMGHRKMLLENKKKHANSLKAKQSEQLRFIKDETAMTNVKMNTILEMVSRQTDHVCDLQKEIKRLRALIDPEKLEISQKGSKEGSVASSSDDTSSILTDQEYCKLKKAYNNRKYASEIVNNVEEEKKSFIQKKSTTRGLDFSMYSRKKSLSANNSLDVLSHGELNQMTDYQAKDSKPLRCSTFLDKSIEKLDSFEKKIDYLPTSAKRYLDNEVRGLEISNFSSSSKSASYKDG
ncbi:unnamed protein product [Moneuplotes crassus]|uniref:Cyclic nucleotide-binding domain-containing protein n=1 Tax=Euplotes crassus TaxID=5936 RepID=A0AAD1XH12_EUPCR|nr:unnamed protein product [Moneuplotes crassus]